MSAIDATRALVALSQDPSADRQQLHPQLQRLFAQLRSCSATEAAEALGILSEAILSTSPQQRMPLAMLCGGLVEDGRDPTPMVEPVIRLLRQLVGPARRFSDACVARIAEKDRGDESRFMAVARELAASMPAESTAWLSLNECFPPIIALFSRHRHSRETTVDLLDDLRAMSDYHQGAHWIVRMLNVLHDEPFIALEPATGLGIVGRMSGISLNFQLNVLLMDVFPQKGWFKTRRVSEAAARIARGDGPQRGNELLKACWNLYTYTALRPDGSLPEGKSKEAFAARDEWIWNEGVPADIPLFEGQRVILLGPPSYERTWDSMRDFQALKADLKVERKLSTGEVSEWLARLASLHR